MENIKKKWLIKKLNKKLSFSKAAKLIVNKKLDELFFNINIFLKDDGVENLHNVRNSIRRVRYILEVVYPCFPQEELLNFYAKLKSLQDLLGEARDLDVIMEKLKFISSTYSSQIDESIYKDMISKRKSFSQQISIALIEFMKSDLINKFHKIKTGDT
ncbi:MAG: CHAD domain-containing protein [bacterium]